MRNDVYQRVTDSIVAEVEKGVRPWLKPWNAEHVAGSGPCSARNVRTANRERLPAKVPRAPTR